MSVALITSALFLTCYLIYHFNVVGVTRFTHPGWPKAIYFFILLTHIPLAALTLPLVILTIIPALRARYDKHRRIAKWTMPIWLYVSVTGVLVYLMLYVWFPPVG
jgi:putative membrane protein